MTFWLIVGCVFIGSLLPNALQWVINRLYFNFLLFKSKTFIVKALPIIFKATDQEKRLRDQFRELKKEMAGISAVDEFARYARTQRKMNKIEEEILNLGQSRMNSREAIRWKWSKIFQVVNVCTIAIIIKR